MPIDIDDLPKVDTPVASNGAIPTLEDVADHIREYITAIVIVTQRPPR